MRLLHHGDFLGREINRICVPGFILTFRRSGSGRKDEKPHCHCNPHVLLALDRGYWSEADGFDESNPSQLFYTPTGTTHRDSMVRLGGRYLSISIDNCIAETCTQTSRYPVALERPIAVRIAHILAMRNMSGHLSKLFVEEACLNIFGELKIHSQMTRRSRPHWLEHVIELCNSGYRELPTISDIGAMIGIHPVHITRVFRNCYGIPLSKYIVSVRIERASAALRVGMLSIAAIAADTGFSDQSHFCKSFKSIMGITPSGYRDLFQVAENPN